MKHETETREETTMTTLNVDRLYWNATGQINCGAHAPYPQSDTWTNEAWQRIAPIVVDQESLQCETCRAITREGR